MGKQEVNKYTCKMALSEQSSVQGSVKEVLREFQVSFFAMSRLPSFPWTFVEKDLQSSGSSELISQVLKQTCLHPLCRKFPPSVRYRRLFLSQLIRRLEASGCEPLDELYDALAEVVGAEETTECYKSYLLPAGGAVSLMENIALISEGTTGLVTWEAALYLAEWALENQQVFTGRTVLELGSGAGLTGIAVCRSCGPKRFIFSDFHSRVLQKLRDNVQLNGLSEQTTPAVSVEKLDWTATSEEELREIGADVIIAADVVYDPDIAGSLAKLLSIVLRCSSVEVLPQVFICSTIRNLETYGGFKQQLETEGVGHEVIPGPVNHVFPYNRQSAIELIKLCR
ncbi:protein-lysine N-methyltransferase EEF2KMT [Pelmatolapia mariae]|uniref:protein-lysine N-methyltransferase EEF2KMT n=1 Tax=Pelmatolapia mariae TaxID=158779 RepID=UPI002FE51B9D